MPGAIRNAPAKRSNEASFRSAPGSPPTCGGVGLAVEPADIGSTEGRLDILVNDAGSSSQIPHANLRASTTIPSTSSFAKVRASPSLLEATGRGLVVNAGSVAGIRGVGSGIAYAACCWSSAAFS